jgi:hypothetical protein
MASAETSIRMQTRVMGGITPSTTLEMTYIPPQMLEASTAAAIPRVRSDWGSWVTIADFTGLSLTDGLIVLAFSQLIHVRLPALCSSQWSKRELSGLQTNNASRKVSRMKNALLSLLVVVAGAFCIAASVKNWDWFFNNRRARLIVVIFGRNGARIFYGLLGSVLALGGLVLGIGLLL